MTATTANKDQKAFDKLRELIRRIDIAMFTTEDAGHLRSRPMSTNGEVEFDGTVWFFTYASSHKVDEVQGDPRVNVSFADPKHHIYISLSGTAQLVRDPQKIKELWRPTLKPWFPRGTEDPDIALLKVTVEQAEYWDNTKSWIARGFELTKGAVTGSQPDMGENKKLEL